MLFYIAPILSAVTMDGVPLGPEKRAHSSPSRLARIRFYNYFVSLRPAALEFCAKEEQFSTR